MIAYGVKGLIGLKHADVLRMQSFLVTSWSKRVHRICSELCFIPQNPPSFTLSDPKPTLARSTSEEVPRRKSTPAEDFKRQSLMEPLNIPVTMEPLLQTTPQVNKYSVCIHSYRKILTILLLRSDCLFSPLAAIFPWKVVTQIWLR